ncbi:MAG: hormogonium polysaccharide secretion pseudopilin HpsC [Jaaginema sp. PMC 1079.18]|nr:hormogonium polysaccharide secretion pseudopilin HpsC [Jaaginema sp. PMC 1080.18]MEC4850543.1 hormogonium polysaccharide secretion pseudopilin HpsC [Jaaginema sp. PMC 1079.18]MEC4867665.1 hormogonium polysaccharide secretion pseudopilin HpsC [Jaaginema sp. PMC 1078.18]
MMMSTSQFLLKQLHQRSQRSSKSDGFTLIELLVAMVIAVIIITPIMGFMVSLMNTDKQEQAKATSEQELQTAIDFITQDLQQAVYIYDNDGLSRNSSNNLQQSGIRNQIPSSNAGFGCPTGATCTPVLVFWKRQFLDRDVQITKAGGGRDSVGNIMAQNNVRGVKGDTYVYSLVGYSLVEGGGTNTPWSNVARIARFEIRDGILQEDGKTYAAPPEAGFKPFDLSIATDLENVMNQWQSDTATRANFDVGDVLIDYITKSGQGVPSPVTCDTNGTVNTKQRITAGNDAFVACVNVEQGTARVYVRGNALARIQPDSKYRNARASFFPLVSTQVDGRGFLFSK